MRFVTLFFIWATMLGACAGAGRSISEWARNAPMEIARSEHPAVLYRGQIVVIGGLVSEGRARIGATETVEAYDPETDSWQRMPDLPQPRHHAMASVASDRLYVIGGFSGEGFTAVDTVWELVDRSWVEREPLPRPIGAGASVAIDGIIYVIGGTPEGGLISYDAETDEWAGLTAPEVFREHVAAVALNGEIWAIGGRAPGAIHDSTEIYDPARETWRFGPTLNEARSGFGAAVVEGSIYVAGGEVFDPDEALDSTERLEPGNGEWERGDRLPVGLHGNPLVSLGSTLYLPGGSTRAAGVENAGEMLSIESR